MNIQSFIKDFIILAVILFKHSQLPWNTIRLKNKNQTSIVQCLGPQVNKVCLSQNIYVRTYSQWQTITFREWCPVCQQDSAIKMNSILTIPMHQASWNLFHLHFFPSYKPVKFCPNQKAWHIDKKALSLFVDRLYSMIISFNSTHWPSCCL